MDTSVLKPNDPRVSYKKTELNGKTYSYICGLPPNQEPIDTILLCHGFPDLAYGWRFQIPYLISLGYRVICPDLLGYAGTDAPQDLAQYSNKSVSADLKALVEKELGEGKQVILGGHDWGGALVFRVALWHPDLVKAIFTVCTPYGPPNPEWTPLEDIVKMLPNFEYQLQFVGPDVEREAQGEEDVRNFINAITGGPTPTGEYAMELKGMNFEKMRTVSRSPFLSEEELSHHVEQYMRHPAPQLRAPLNWYRTRRVNWEEEKELLDQKGPEVVLMKMPVLYIGATNDFALPPAMSAGMEKLCPDLTRGEVEATHWALWEKGQDVNDVVGEWLEKIAPKLKSSL